MAHQPLSSLCNIPFVLKMGRLLNLRSMADGVLSRVPWIKSTSTGIRYRLDRLEAVFIAEETFWKNSYTILESENFPFQTYADIGCNRGFFSLYLFHLSRLKKLEPPQGICVEANARLIEIIKANFQRNGREDIEVKYGVAGAGLDVTSVDFYISAQDGGSSQFRGETRETVPALQMGPTWNSKFGERTCDLLKLDIEGSEGTFLKTETTFMKKVNFAVIEYHEPQSPRELVEHEMKNLGFECVGFEPNLQAGVLFFRRI